MVESVVFRIGRFEVATDGVFTIIRGDGQVIQVKEDKIIAEKITHDKDGVASYVIYTVGGWRIVVDRHGIGVVK